MTDAASLFRSEFQGQRAERLHGSIVIRQSLSARLVTAAIILMAAAGISLLALGSYARIETARGILVPTQSATKIFALRSGVVDTLFIEDGQFVEKGQRLASVQAVQPDGAGQTYTEEGVKALGQQEDLARQRVRLSTQRATVEERRIQTTVAGLIRQKSQLKEQLRLQAELVNSARSTYEQLSTLLDKGFISRIEIERRRQALIIAQQQQGQLVQQLVQIDTEIEQSAGEATKTSVDQRLSVIDGETSIRVLRQQKARIGSEGRYRLDAPTSGRVTAVQTAVGKTVTAQLPLPTIMPDKSILRADVYAPSRAIGFVRKGQEVRLLYDAFPYQRFGSFSGKVASISRIVLAPAEVDAPLRIEEPVYRLAVDLDQQSVSAFGNKYPLRPGMTFTANIVLDRLSFWDWLIAPMRAIRNRT